MNSNQTSTPALPIEPYIADFDLTAALSRIRAAEWLSVPEQIATEIRLAHIQGVIEGRLLQSLK